jgi:tripartite-type tricarboxylate transporter receptor subunit TctC
VVFYNFIATGEKMMIYRIFFTTMVCFFTLAFTAPLYAANFPDKEITMVIPWAAGGGTDLVGRKIASLIEKDLGKPVVVINKPGGGGMIGFQFIAAAKPDGYTIGLTTNSMLLQKYFAPNHLPYQALNIFIMVNYDPAALTVPATSSFNSPTDFIKAAKEKPGTLRVSDAGPGSIWQVSSMMFEKAAGIKLVHVPYNGGNPAAVAAAGGHVEATFASPGECSSLIAAGKLKVLATTSDSRLPEFPDVPTFKEKGIDVVSGVWRAFCAPAGTPAPVIERLEAAVKKAMETDEYKAFLKNANLGFRYMGNKDMLTILAEEDMEYAAVKKDIDQQK